MRRTLIIALLLATALLGIAQRQASAVPVNPCAHPETATQHLDAPGTLNGTSGDDILFGSTGADKINGKGGDDVICGNGGADKIDGGTGDDQIEAIDGSSVKGGAGEDWIIVSGWGTIGDGGSNDDRIVASDGAIAKGNSGNDTIYANGAQAAYGDSGRDTIYNDGYTPYVNCGSGRDNYENALLTNDVIPEVTVISCEQPIAR